MIIVCVLGKSGSGKSTIEAALENRGYNRIISYTTRNIRGNETHGKEYYFVSKEEFKGLLNKGLLMEHTVYRDEYYGAPKPVGGTNHVIVVEAEGFRAIKELYGDQAIGVYVDVPDDEIKNRIIGRSDTSVEEAKLRSIEDALRFESIKNSVDLVVDGRQPVDQSVFQILKYIRDARRSL